MESLAVTTYVTVFALAVAYFVVVRGFSWSSKGGDETHEEGEEGADDLEQSERLRLATRRVAQLSHTRNTRPFPSAQPSVLPSSGPLSLSSVRGRKRRAKGEAGRSGTTRESRKIIAEQDAEFARAEELDRLAQEESEQSELSRALQESLALHRRERREELIAKCPEDFKGRDGIMRLRFLLPIKGERGTRAVERRFEKATVTTRDLLSFVLSAREEKGGEFFALFERFPRRELCSWSPQGELHVSAKNDSQLLIDIGIGDGTTLVVEEMEEE